eukprot:snap_masked-scaffold_11-processed-gene-11.4-mRNA-1 protein AED:1.00 eAED:1.00 QI:0/-1/0/0/-1/1/1/0/370
MEIEGKDEHRKRELPRRACKGRNVKIYSPPSGENKQKNRKRSISNPAVNYKDSRIVANPVVRKNKGREVVNLWNWSFAIVYLKGCNYVYVKGTIFRNGEEMQKMSSVVKKVKRGVMLLTETDKVYNLKGRFQSKKCEPRDLDKKIIEKFKEGFPDDWNQIIQSVRIQAAVSDVKKEKEPKIKAEKTLEASKEVFDAVFKEKVKSKKGTKKYEKEKREAILECARIKQNVDRLEKTKGEDNDFMAKGRALADLIDYSESDSESEMSAAEEAKQEENVRIGEFFIPREKAALLFKKSAKYQEEPKRKAKKKRRAPIQRKLVNMSLEQLQKNFEKEKKEIVLMTDEEEEDEEMRSMNLDLYLDDDEDMYEKFE